MSGHKIKFSFVVVVVVVVVAAVVVIVVVVVVAAVVVIVVVVVVVCCLLRISYRNYSWTTWRRHLDGCDLLSLGM